MNRKYSDQLVEWLGDLGYTHCFFVAGGNIMHLLDSVRTKMECIPFVHEVGAAIAVEYFNASRDETQGRAFALVTAGPGITNALTGIAGAWQESRELLIIGGQVKSSDLSHGALRQRGIQEIDGVALAQSVCKSAIRIERPVPRHEIDALVREGRAPRQGPVFLEICLDAQAARPLADDGAPSEDVDAEPVSPSDHDVALTAQWLAEASRPVILVGGGVSRDTIRNLWDASVAAGVPLMTTWNGSDRVPSDHPLYAGRPNTWGQRAANILIQQADVVVAVGTRLGLQQTGFAWEQFAPLAKVVQVDIDEAELRKGHPRVDLPICADADEFVGALYADMDADEDMYGAWREFIALVTEKLPLADPQNTSAPGFIDPYKLALSIAEYASDDDVILPCSSGGAATVSMQALRLRGRQKLVGDKSLASMGYGLSGALGAALANPGRRVFLTEGDGGFAQNLQELGTLAALKVPVKILLMVNDGYASIRMTQRNYFNGAWIGCDAATGLGLPEWDLLAKAYGIDFTWLDPEQGLAGDDVRGLLDSDRPALIAVPIDPDQTYYPKITSSIQSDGSMKSNPLHLMDPQLDDDIAQQVMPYLLNLKEHSS